ncbi:hypothetical protein [Pseudomonas orientalis]|uniref:Uncharacterized protein n=1 Tax=Pseudomonas orientalis TaxID=76758 RepID=A0A1H2ER65_9PSED|nr:hypothetical protein [Pseudomonas orientalis]KRP67720.1 hypothetical protein TU82_02955 [Pseudomonas orientalis]SDT97672.1 hypothetical protein SAMN04490197_1606 [Pseudomonas orientalis]
MSQSPFTSTTNGRLNLEQQRKRAKQLLLHLKHEDPNATLSQAQWQIAKALGFSSWPKLKAHIAEAGPVPFGRVFAELMAKREPLPFLGDMMFHALLRPLIDGDQPLLVETETHLEWPRRELALTPLGLEVLDANAYWPDHSSHARWIGGICIEPARAHWTVDGDAQPVWRSARE